MPGALEADSEVRGAQGNQVIPDAAVEAAAKAMALRDHADLVAWINDTSRLPNDLPGYGPRGQAKSGPIYPLGKIEDKRRHGDD